MIDFHFHVLKEARLNILKVTQDFGIDQLNVIPKGFNNNIIWNMGHLLVTQQLLVHRLGGADMYVTEDEVQRFRKGSKPDDQVTAAEVSDIRERLTSIQALSLADVKEGKMANYREYTTSFGVTLPSVEKAIAFNNAHEGLHFGTILAMCKLVDAMNN